jgi:hypothetical protein
MYLPAAWTDLGPEDPFVKQAKGRAIARVEDLLELARLTAEHVKEITPKRKVIYAAGSGGRAGKIAIKAKKRG